MENLVSYTMIDITKRIFITGVTGFVGANILRRLIEMGARDVHILIRPTSSLTRIRDIIDKVTIHKFSLEERFSLMEHIRDISPQVVFHMAAAGTSIGKIPFSIEDLYRANTLSSINLMDACYEAGTCEVFINTGSSSEYGQKHKPMNELDMPTPNNLYGISKLATTQYAVYLGKQRLFPIATYRIFSAYGPYEDEKRLIPTLLSSYIEGCPPCLSSPFSVRDFIYIDDIVSCYLEADIAVRNPGDIINLGTGKQHSIEQVVDIVRGIFGSNISPTYGENQAKQIEPSFWLADSSKMKTIFSISPIDLEDGLSLTLQWIKKSL